MIYGIIDQNAYVNILIDVLLSYAEWIMQLKWTFQQDNYPKHTRKSAKNWFNQNRIEITPWPGPSSDTSPIENLWETLKNMCRRFPRRLRHSFGKLCRMHGQKFAANVARTW